MTAERNQSTIGVDRHDIRSESTHKFESDRRRFERYGAAQIVAACSSNKQFHAELIDLSAAGLRLHIAAGHALCKGDLVEVVLLDSTRVFATVTWCLGDQIGAQLDQHLADVEGHASLDHRGEDLFRQVIKIQNGIRNNNGS
jgi:hypothetical protein